MKLCAAARPPARERGLSRKPLVWRYDPATAQGRELEDWVGGLSKAQVERGALYPERVSRR